MALPGLCWLPHNQWVPVLHWPLLHHERDSLALLEPSPTPSQATKPSKDWSTEKCHLNQQQKSDWTWRGWLALTMLGLDPKDHQKVSSWASPMWEGSLGSAQHETGCHRIAAKLRNFLGSTALGSRCRSKYSAKLLWIQRKQELVSPVEPTYSVPTQGTDILPGHGLMRAHCALSEPSQVSLYNTALRPEETPLLSCYLQEMEQA